MDANLSSYLTKNNIQYQAYEHPPVRTVEESKNIKINIPGKHTKCLFMKDDKEQFYLVALPAEKRLNTKYLKKKLGIKSLSFASPQELKQILNLSPGSVSIFGMIHAKNVFLIIDKSLWDADLVGFHPNINTSTIVLNHENFEKFFNLLKSKKEIIEL